MMCSQYIGRPSCYFSAWGAGSGQASSRCSALCTCKQACRRLEAGGFTYSSLLVTCPATPTLVLRGFSRWSMLCT